MTYKAAVIIPTRGGASKLHYPLDALIQQTEKDFQVIVVIDGDIDASEEVVNTYISERALNLSVIVLPENRGRVAALNAGHQAADANILIRCDDDIEMNPDYIASHLSYHLGDQEVGAMGLVHNLYPDTPHARVFGHYRDKRFREDAYASDPSGHWHFWAANCSMSARMYQAVGGYDTRYKQYGWEDVDMGRMLADRGAKMILAKNLEVQHHIAATTTAGRARRALYSGAARNIFLAKHGENALPPLRPTGMWGLAVRTFARIQTEFTIKIMGETADKIIDKLPFYAGEKIVSLIVESAGYAGSIYPHRARKKF
ncbi:glycosyltransferase family 2 protein [Rothia sp. ZJ1223]|uniref:glycosyltransferase family 2 protein n=1 Tax=Rothia sp. ZJ1223 TaxID=2811098 RepID=UPI001957CB35|nr:glycosyltransferase family 2 protein [Rothia sp. ZJ1223]MBM7051402.1 glycosyltransferase family 2 protein [Rothia sp. ZJ1223]